jgi:hypothetical protein
MSSEPGSAPDSKPASGSPRAQGAADVVERKPAPAKAASRSGHAVEPPPSIRPKSKPKPTVGAAAPVKRVGHGDGESGPSHPKTGGSPGAAKRSYRTTRAAPVVVSEPTAKKPPPASAPSGAPGPVRTSARAPASAPGGLARAPQGPPRSSAAGPAGATKTVPAVRPQTGGASAGPGTLTQVVAAAAGAQTPAAAAGKKGSKRVKLNLSYIAPLSVMKISFLVSVALGIAFVVAVYILWSVLNDREVFTQIDQMIIDVVGTNRPEPLKILNYVEQGKVMSGAAIIAVVDVIVLTVMSTLVAVIYNILAALVGGVRVTLKER